MNKQEAIVALLEVVRRWEEPNREVRAAEVDNIFTTLFAAAGDLDTLRGLKATTQNERNMYERLVTIGASALWLMIDEVTLVEGKALDVWLAERQGNWSEEVVMGKPIDLAGIEAAAAYMPTRVNG